jgi:hypothetical protein
MNLVLKIGTMSIKTKKNQKQYSPETFSILPPSVFSRFGIRIGGIFFRFNRIFARVV